MLLSGVAAAGALLSAGRVALGVGATLPALRWAAELLLSIVVAAGTLLSIVAAVGGTLLALDGVIDRAVLSLDGVVVNELMLLDAEVARGAVLLLLLLLLEHCATVRTTAPQRNKAVAEPITRWRTASR
jgi:hypothetical protein